MGRALGIGQGGGRAALLLVGVAVAVLALAVSIAGWSPGFAPATPSPDASGAIAAGTPTPKPTPTGTLPGVATPTPAITASPQPEGIIAKRVRIPRLGIDLRIIEGDGTEAPMNKAAHYAGTAWPGGGSNIYLYAHAQTGMFLALWNAKVGDEIFLDLKDGTSRRYVVGKVLPKVAWNALEYLEPTPTEQLTLQTSTSYTATAPRFIVIAEPAP